MSFSGLAFQALDGLASASGLFFVAAGLSLIFGVTRIVNIAHGSLYMLGTYIAYTLVTALGGAVGFWGGIVLTAIVVAAIGAAIEVVVLRRVYVAPELFQLLATFALLLIINDAVLWLWGPDDLLGPRAPGLRGAFDILGRRMPSYDAFLIVVAPLVLGALYIVFARTRFGRLVRAATQDREMLGALGVNQSLLFTAVFAVGAGLAGLGGALQVAREPANLGMDLTAITDAFVVVVVGGMGSIVGSYVAAVLIAEVKALVHRPRPRLVRRFCRELFQAHAGRRVSGHGRGADRAPAGPVGPPAHGGARRGRNRGAAAPGVALARRVRRCAAPGADRAAAFGARRRLMCWCSASTC